MNFIQLNSNKQPLTKLDKQYYKEDYSQLDNAGVVLGKNIIVLDFDNDNENEDDIIKFIEQNYPTLVVETNRGKHFYYKMPKGYVFNRSIKTISNIGFQCDYLTGDNSYSVIKQNGVVRKMNRAFSFEDLPELPELFYPLKKVKDRKLSGLTEGDARNNKLYSHLLSLIETYPNINIETITNVINDVIFVEKLSQKELDNIIKSVLKKDTKPIINKEKFNEINYSSVKDLKEKNLPPITFFVDNLIPQGLTLICSLPKIGKSFMAFDLCLSIAKGVPFLGFNTKKASCLYLALEDSENRLQDRLNKILNGDTAPDNFLYSIRCNDIETGLIQQLEDIITKEPLIKVIVIDTLQKIRSSYKGNNNYANDYHELGKLKEFADARGLSIILIHHLKKGNENDVFEKVSGTNGITGTVDTTIVLNKENRADENTTLSIVGRDVEFNQLVIKFNKNIFKWQMIASYDEIKAEKEKEEYENNPLVATIKHLVKNSNGNWSGTLKDITSKFKELYPYLAVRYKSITTKMLKEVSDKLKKYDNIKYYYDPFPKKGKREKNFYI